ncbi:DUF3054 domain-containing protein [Mycobacterium sp. 141]|uniref:DUF3054 domain-containing protein n=1 Tax=Mycobacterium sp. 141 TaxID=1120797 RepID=UPI00035DA7B8|nr:DUF3054 domain-containing protein [Mycobacterium sp. 141]
MRRASAPAECRRRRGSAALLTDLIAVVVFCTIGRRSHAEGITVTGVAETAWPFLVGTLTGWLVSRGWQRPTSLAPTGIAVWIATVVVGMLLRKLTSAGVAGSFIVVASLVTAVFLLGWRAALAGLRRNRVQSS